MAGRVPAGRVRRQGAAVLAAFALIASAPAAHQQTSDRAAPIDPQAEAAQALCAAGDAEHDQAQYAAARAHALQCAEIYDRLADPRGIGRANHLLSRIADLSGDRAEAETRARRAIAAYDGAGDVRGRAIATLQLIRLGIYVRGEDLRLLREVIADARAIGDRGIEGRAFHSLGDHLFTAGAYEEALDALTQAAAILDGQDRPSLGRVYNSLGRLYRTHGRPDEALKYQLQALAIHESERAQFDLLQSLNAVAVTYQSLGDAKSSRAYLERALALAEQTSSPRIQDFLRANLVSNLFDQGAYAEAARNLEGVLARGMDSYPSMRMRQLSSAYLRLGRRDEAMTLAQRALDACKNRELDCLYALDQRAEVHAALGHTDAALADTAAALEKVEAVRSKLVPADFFKQQFNHAQETIYSRAISLQVRDGRGADAIATAELARSRAFIDLLASKDLQPRDMVAPGALVFRGAPVASRGDRADLPSQVAARPATADDLIAITKRLHSTLLAYWVTTDRVFIWVVGQDGRMHTSQVNVRAARLEELIRATAPLEKTGATARTSNAWRELYDLIVKPVRRALPRDTGSLVTVVPHGPLSALSFGALKDERNRYLLEDFTLHYVPAGAVLQFTASKRHPESRQGRVLLVADPVPPVLSRLEAPLPRLAGARAEVRSIARLMPAARVTALEGDAATKDTIRTAAAGKAVLHFATHAIVRDEDPFGSFLAVSPVTAKPGRMAADGLLTAREIYGLDLDADLVVLSACRSAAGRVSGDGIATFARAFIYAGTPSLVASVWDVADQPTNRLLPEFYRSWLGGATKARALRSAQLRLLRDLRAGTLQIDTPLGKVVLSEHPVFWAGFALFGEPD